MVIDFFKRNHPVLIAAIVGSVVLLWTYFIFNLNLIPAETGGKMPLYKGVANAVANIKPISVFISIALLSAVAILLNRLITNHNFPAKGTYLGALVFITFSALIAPATALHEVLISGLFILLMLSRLFSLYKKQFALKEVFEAGLFSGLASLFYLPSLVTLLVIWLGLLVLRRLVWREWVIAPIAACIPFMFLFTILYVNGNLNEVIDINFRPVFENFLSWNLELSWVHISVLIPVVLVTIFAGFRVLLHSSKTSIQIRKNFYILFWLSLCSSVSVFFAEPGFEYGVVLVFMPVSIIVASLIDSIQRPLWANLLFVLMLASVITFQVLNLY